MNPFGSKIILNLSPSIFLTTAFLLLKTAPALAFDIHFDYSYDDNNFFSGSEGEIRKNTLDRAAQYYETYINDNLSAILEDASSPTGIGYEFPGGQKNTWTISFDDPATGTKTSITDPTFIEDRIVIYVGGRELSSLGNGGTGGLSYSAFSGTSNGTSYSNEDFVNLVKGRGQAGALTDPVTDIGLWGGSITFDNNITIDSNTYNWHNEITPTGLDSDEYDFLSIAVHEIGHVLGIGGQSWDNNVSGTDFTGDDSISAYNQANNLNASAVPLHTTSTSHWLDGTEGLTLQGINQETVLDPSILNGQRKLPTNLDYAGLSDIGWEVERAAINANVPFEFSPALGVLLSCSFFSCMSIKNWLKKVRLNR